MSTFHCTVFSRRIDVFPRWIRFSSPFCVEQDVAGDSAARTVGRAMEWLGGGSRGRLIGFRSFGHLWCLERIARGPGLDYEETQSVDGAGFGWNDR